MDRNCDKCIHHTSGMCDSWECKMQTVEDVKKEAVNEYVEAVVAELEKRNETALDKVKLPIPIVVSKQSLQEVVDMCFEEAISIVRGKE